MKYICTVCGYIYDEAREKVLFASLPDSWKCPVCKAAKALFAPQGQPEAAPPPAPPEERAPAAFTGSVKGFSAGVLSAVCSNLARGCEKQYQEEHAAAYRALAESLKASAPVPSASLERLEALLREDVERRYPAQQAAAAAKADRGTQRVRVWGEKVTNMQRSLVQQYRQEGEAFLRGADLWVCSVCGFLFVGEKPPEICPVCKVPAWKFDRVEGRETA